LRLALAGPLRQWSSAVLAQRDRLSGDELDVDSRQADAALFVAAVRNVVRLARAVSALGKDPQLDAAMWGIEVAVPGARSVRGALEHFDDYHAHRRFLRRARVTAGQRVQFERGAERAVVSVGELAFDMDVVAGAALEPADAILNAVDRTVGAHGGR
jgi:hypothetical protein